KAGGAHSPSSGVGSSPAGSSSLFSSPVTSLTTGLLPRPPVFGTALALDRAGLWAAPVGRDAPAPSAPGVAPERKDAGAPEGEDAPAPSGGPGGEDTGTSEASTSS